MAREMVLRTRTISPPAARGSGSSTRQRKQHKAAAIDADCAVASGRQPAAAYAAARTTTTPSDAVRLHRLPGTQRNRGLAGASRGPRLRLPYNEARSPKPEALVLVMDSWSTTIIDGATLVRGTAPPVPPAPPPLTREIHLALVPALPTGVRYVTAGAGSTDGTANEAVRNAAWLEAAQGSGHRHRYAAAPGTAATVDRVAAAPSPLVPVHAVPHHHDKLHDCLGPINSCCHRSS